MIEPKGIASLARLLMDKHGLKDWMFEFDRAVRRAGCCKHRIKTITLSIHYVTRNNENIADIKDTILHEIAHALAGHGAGHGPKWKAMCVKIGARPIRCYDSNKVDMPKGQYVAKCGGCSKLFHKHRRPRRSRYFCRKCGPQNGQLVFRRKGVA